MGSFEQRTGILFPLLVSCIERGISEKTRATFGVFLIIIKFFYGYQGGLLFSLFFIFLYNI
jgi:uncharacterized membrane protein YfhO